MYVDLCYKHVLRRRAISTIQNHQTGNICHPRQCWAVFWRLFPDHFFPAWSISKQNAFWLTPAWHLIQAYIPRSVWKAILRHVAVNNNHGDSTSSSRSIDVELKMPPPPLWKYSDTVFYIFPLIMTIYLFSSTLPVSCISIMQQPLSSNFFPVRTSCHETVKRLFPIMVQQTYGTISQ